MKTKSAAAAEEEQSNHVSQVWQVNKDRIESMKRKISATPKLLIKSAGDTSCSIFRVPQSLIDINGTSYQPHIVSIGPYHNSEPHLQMIEEHKWRYLGMLLNRTQSTGLTLEDYLKAIQPLEMRARECYSETIPLNTDELVEILVVDGCFLIEIFRRVGKLVPVEPGDPLTGISWVYSFFLRDFVRLENQIPFFVLEQLFDMSLLPGEESGPSLAVLVMKFFNNAVDRSDKFISEYCSRHQGKHLLDFLWSSFVPTDQDMPKRSVSSPGQVIPCISKLRRAGIKLRSGKEDSFLVIKFRHGIIEMPTIAVDDFMSCFMINCVAYEQCHRTTSKHFTTYATFLDCLINTARDVEYLSEKNIVENYFGTETELAKFINNLGKDVTFDIESCYLANLFKEVNEYYMNGWHVQWAGLRYTYFSSPWSFISALAAFILLVLSVLQTYYTVTQYYRGP